MSSEEVCRICLSEMNTNERKFLPCMHCYHMSCIDQWISVKRQQAKCPICNVNIADAVRLSLISSSAARPAPGFAGRALPLTSPLTSPSAAPSAARPAPGFAGRALPLTSPSAAPSAARPLTSPLTSPSASWPTPSESIDDGNDPALQLALSLSLAMEDDGKTNRNVPTTSNQSLRTIVPTQDDTDGGAEPPEMLASPEMSIYDRELKRQLDARSSRSGPHRPRGNPWAGIGVSNPQRHPPMQPSMLGMSPEELWSGIQQFTDTHLQAQLIQRNMETLDNDVENMMYDYMRRSLSDTSDPSIRIGGQVIVNLLQDYRREILRR